MKRFLTFLGGMTLGFSIGSAWGAIVADNRDAVERLLWSLVP